LPVIRRAGPPGLDDRGSAIHLFPVGILAVLVLGAITVDVAVVHLATAQALDAATAAADDAVAAGLDRERLRAGDGYVVAPGAAQQVALRSVHERGLAHVVEEVAVTVGPGPEVEVRVTLRVEPIFAGVVPGAGPTRVSATGRATAVTR
jgi:hypothetical protein